MPGIGPLGGGPPLPAGPPILPPIIIGGPRGPPGPNGPTKSTHHLYQHEHFSYNNTKSTSSNQFYISSYIKLCTLKNIIATCILTL